MTVGEAVGVFDHRPRDRDVPDDAIEFHATTFVVAGGYVWSPHLLLLSQHERFPDGLANSSGLVGKYLNGHRNVSAFVSLPMKLYRALQAGAPMVR